LVPMKPLPPMTFMSFIEIFYLLSFGLFRYESETPETKGLLTSGMAAFSERSS